MASHNCVEHLSPASLIALAQETKRGFIPIRDLATTIMNSRPSQIVKSLALELLDSPVRQARMLATLLLGNLAGDDPDSVTLLRDHVSSDPDWRVQEMLAMAFDAWLRDVGYLTSIAAIRDWLSDPRPNVRRAACEGLRPWTAPLRFGGQPELAIELITTLRADPSPYVRKSCGNALRDVGRKYPDLTCAELAEWDRSDPDVLQTWKLAAKFLK